MKKYLLGYASCLATLIMTLEMIQHGIPLCHGDDNWGQEYHELIEWHEIGATDKPDGRPGIDWIGWTDQPQGEPGCR